MTINFKLPSYIIRTIGIDLAGIKSDIDILRLPPEAKKILHGAKNLIIQRFKIFQEQIDNEEMASNHTAYILMDFTSDPLEIKYINYSETLKNRMKESLSIDDFIYLERFGLK